jgi:hypothetical protein
VFLDLKEGVQTRRAWYEEKACLASVVEGKSTGSELKGEWEKRRRRRERVRGNGERMSPWGVFCAKA